MIVTGSQTWTDGPRIEAAMIEAYDSWPKQLRVDRSTLAYGKCPIGADYFAEYYAKRWAWRLDPYSAHWRLYGNAAGPIRNTFMVNDGADICLAFINPCIKENCTRQPKPHGSHGTTHCADFAEAAGIPVKRYFYG